MTLNPLVDSDLLENSRSLREKNHAMLAMLRLKGIAKSINQIAIHLNLPYKTYLHMYMNTKDSNLNTPSQKIK